MDCIGENLQHLPQRNCALASYDHFLRGSPGYRARTQERVGQVRYIDHMPPAFALAEERKAPFRGGLEQFEKSVVPWPVDRRRTKNYMLDRKVPGLRTQVLFCREL